MKSARDRAIDIVQELLGVGKSITKQIDVVERGLIRDRADCDKARSDGNVTAMIDFAEER